MLTIRDILAYSTTDMDFRILAPEQYPTAINLVAQLNPKTNPDILALRLEQLSQPGYELLGAYDEGQLIGICGMWTMFRLYIGKLMEIDNVAVDERYRSTGVGKQMMDWVENYARAQGCQSIELNTYVNNHRSHKFYYNQGFVTLGYHMQKRLG